MKVIEAKTVGDGVRVNFDDGHFMLFDPYTHGFGYQVEGLMQLRMCKETINNLVFLYHGRLYRCGPQSDEHKIIEMKEGYTQQLIAEYWDAAREWLNDNYFNVDPSPKELWYPWMLVCTEGGFDLGRLRKNGAEFREDEDEQA